MLAYIKGKIVFKAADYFLLESGDVAYQLQHDPAAVMRFPALGETAKIWTYLQVKEDGMSLFAFATQEEKQMFELLLTVSGIGPKAAAAICGSLQPSTFAMAVLADDLVTLCQVKGIGKKGAQRLVLELKDKLKGMARSESLPGGAPILPAVSQGCQQEAIEALMVLGYQQQEALRAVRRVEAASGELTLEEEIRQALKFLASL